MNKRYNSKLKRYVILNEGERFCPKCDGKGEIPKKSPNFFSKSNLMLVCNKCLGDGKIDWVENVVGKKVKNGEGISQQSP